MLFLTANLRFPSMMKATCLGIGPVFKMLSHIRWSQVRRCLSGNHDIMTCGYWNTFDYSDILSPRKFLVCNNMHTIKSCIRKSDTTPGTFIGDPLFTAGVLVYSLLWINHNSICSTASRSHAMSCHVSLMSKLRKRHNKSYYCHPSARMSKVNSTVDRSQTADDRQKEIFRGMHKWRY